MAPPKKAQHMHFCLTWFSALASGKAEVWLAGKIPAPSVWMFSNDSGGGKRSEFAASSSAKRVSYEELFLSHLKTFQGRPLTSLFLHFTWPPHWPSMQRSRTRAWSLELTQAQHFFRRESSKNSSRKIFISRPAHDPSRRQESIELPEISGHGAG